jgi:hypothetical protein
MSLSSAIPGYQRSNIGSIRERQKLLAPVGQKRDVLIGLHALTVQHFDQPPLGVSIQAVDESDITKRPILRHRPPDDHLEIVRSVSAIADITAVETHHHSTARDRKAFPIGRTPVKE